MVKRSVNLPLLIGTVFVGAILAGGVYGLHKWQISRTAQGLKVLADAQEKIPDWIKAASYLDRYLRLRPDDAPAAGRLALTYARGAKSVPERQRAVSLHYRALALDLGDKALEVRGGLADLLLDLNRLVEAEKEARELLKANENDPRGTRVLALALAGQWSDGSLARVVKSDDLKKLGILAALDKARETNPSDPQVALVQATLLRESAEVVAAELPLLALPDRTERANAIMEQLVRENPQDGAVYLARNSYRRKYALDGVESDLEEAVRLAPDDSKVLLEAGLSALNTGVRLKAAAAAGDTSVADKSTAELAKAKGYFEKLVAKPDERLPDAYLSLGDVQLALNQRDAAHDTWREGLKQFRQPTIQITLHAKIAESLLEADRADEARQPLDEIKTLVDKLGTSVPRDLRVAFERGQDLRTARWHVQRSELAPAIPLLRSVALRQPQGDPNITTTLQALYLLGSIQFRLGEWVESATTYDEATRLAPAFQQSRLAAAQAYLMAGRPRLAAERAEQALASTKTVDAWLVLASAEYQEQVAMPRDERNWRRLEEALDVLEQAKPELAQSAPWRIDFLRIDYLMAKAGSSDSPAAVPTSVTEALKAAEAAYSGQKAFWLQICLAYQNLDLLGEADRALVELRKAGGTPVEVAVAESRLAGRRGDHKAAEKILEDAAKSVSVADRAALRAELLKAAVAAKNPMKVREILVDENRRQPGDLSVIRRLAELELEQRDFAAVEHWAAQAAKADNGTPGKLLAQYLRSWSAYLTAENSAAVLKPVLADLEQVVLARPGWAEAVALKGLVELRLELQFEAAADLERAVNLGERRIFVYEQLITLLERQQRWSDAEQYLSRLTADVPKSQGLAEAAAAFELQRERPEDAVKIARQRLALRPDDPRANLWLGRMLLRSGALDEAEQSFQKAMALGPADPGTWIALLGHYHRTKEKDKAARVLAQLEQNKEIDETQKILLLAQGYDSIGQQDAARKQFGELAGRTTSDLNMQLKVAQFYLKSNPLKAEPILRAALTSHSESDAARRMLALAVALQGDKGLEEAQLLLTPAGVDGAVANDDQRIRALLLVQKGGLVNLDRAVQIVAGLIANEATPAPGDRQLLARLYELQAQAMDDPAQIAEKVQAARTQWEQVASASDAPPASLAALVQFLVKHNQTADALSWLDKLEKRVEDPRSKLTDDLVSLVVQMQLLTGASERSEKWLARLGKAGIAGGLRALALEAQVAKDRNPGTDLKGLIEPRAKELAAAATKPSDQAAIYAGIGDLYTNLKQPALAEPWYRSLVAIASEQYPLLVASLTSQQRLSDAIGVCREAAKIDLTVQPAMVLTKALTDGQPKEQDFKEASPIIDAAVARFPEDVGLLYAVSLVDLLQEKYDEAVKRYRQILAANPQHVAALNNLAMLLAERPANREEAIRQIDKAIEIVGKDPGLLDTKGAILVYSSRPAEALPLLVSATRGDKADPRHHFHLAIAYRELGKLEEAKAQFLIARERELDRQLLMPIDQRYLAEMRSALPQ